MSECDLNNHKSSIIELAQQWKMEIIDQEGLFQLNCWYSSLAGEPLGSPDGLTVEKVEYWLHKQFFRPQPVDHAALQAMWDAMKNDDKPQ